ncbi:MAG: BppU family phage baseplate upper protein [Lachnospiraceae bacterium]|nr:BppU family phage baseplate upper protein [Lachnospiraceae bacterium]
MNEDNINIDDINRLSLDLSVPRIVNVRCVQGDTDSRKLIITLTNDGEFFPLDNSITVKYKLRKPDGKPIYNGDAISVNDGRIHITLSEQATACAGVVRAELQLLKNSQKISTMPFNIIVEPSVVSNEDILSAYESDVVNGMIDHLKDYDNPHKTTKEQIGLGNVDDTHDIDKNVSSAKKLTTARNINGTLFDGTTDIITDKWGKLRTVKLSGDVSASKSVDGSSDIDIAVEVKDNSHNHTVSNISDLTATVNELNVLDGITATTTELNYTDGVTSNIQSQLDAKASIDSPSMTGTPKAPTASAGTNTTQIATTAFTQTEIANHNTSPTAHANIRNLISDLTARLNALADSDDTTLDQLSEIVAYIKSNRTLIENVTTNKVNVSDIVDNLTSTSTNKPLSAKQGKILKDLIDSLTTVGNFEESDMFLAYLASNNNGPLCLLSQTVGDTITTNGRSAINSKGVKTLIFNGALYSTFDNTSVPYGGHIIVTTDGTSWEDNDANDNYGMQSGAGEVFTTPAGNTVYMKTMAGSWALTGNFPVTAVLNGKTYTIKTRTLFRYSPSSLKWALELADFYLFKANLPIINYNNVTPIINGIKSLSTVGTLGYGTNNDYIPNIACLSFWNGKYNDNGSNLAYCNKGAFGDIVTHAASEFLSTSGGTSSGALGTSGSSRIYAGDKIRMWTDNEGGNLEITSADGKYSYQMDACGNNFRVYCFETSPWKYLASFYFTKEGKLGAPELYEKDVSLKDKYAALSHTHNYLPLTGGTLSGAITVTGRIWGNITSGYNMSLNSTTGESLILHQKSGSTIWGVGTRQDNSYGWYHWNNGLKMNLTESGDLIVSGNARLGEMSIASDSTNFCFYIGGTGSHTNNYPRLKMTQFSNSFQIIPTQANQCTIGHTSIPFESMVAKNIYNSSGLITSSDKNKKKDFENITQDFAEQIIDGLVPTSFKYKDGDSGRTHYGLVAQDVEKLLEELGIDSKDFAPLIKEYPKKEVENEDGNKTLVTDYDSEPEYFLRYEGFIGLIIKYIQGLKQENNDLKDKMSQLENRLELLESRLNNI